MPSLMRRIQMPTGAEATILRLNCSCSSSRKALSSAGRNILRSNSQARVNSTMADSRFSSTALRISILKRSTTVFTGTAYTMLSEDGGNAFFMMRSR
ncbi:hypothetical protein D3C76_1378170 [compost metagenome]